MPFSYAQYTGNGSTTTFSVPFPYLLKAHVKLFYGYNLTAGTFTSELVDGVGFTWLSGTQVQTTAAPAAGVVLTVVRQTPSNALAVQWQDGSNLVANDLIDSSLQNLYAVQEQEDVVTLSSALSVTAEASAATALSAANAASATANGIAGTANTALSSANAAVTTANAASSTATTAETTANGIAGTANTALSNANAAVTTANAASTTANGIAGTANTALSNANAAVTTANAASATANGIAGTANTALTNANAAVTAVDAALPKAGGTMTGQIVFAAGQAITGYLASGSIGTTVQGYDVDTAKTDVAQNFTAAQRGSITTLTDGATITPDFAVANNYSVTLAGNRTLANPTNLTAGQSGCIYITQDGTGSRTLAYGSDWDFGGGTVPTLTTTAAAVDVLAYAVRTTGSIAATLIKDVK